MFRLSWQSPLIAVFALFFCILAAFAWPHVTLLVSLAVQFGVALVMFLLLSVVVVSEKGIVLYRFNRLEWSNVEAVRRTSVFGLPYLLIKRHKGFHWWLPLYFSGTQPIEAALAEKAPIGNPLRIYAESNT